MIAMSVFWLLVWLLAAAGVVAIGIFLMLRAPLEPPPQLASIGEGAMRIDSEGLPGLSRFQARDGTWLAYRLHPSNRASDRIAILAHGSAGSSAQMNGVARALANVGITAVGFDFRGHGASGTRGDVAYSGQLDEDLADLIDELRKSEPERPLLFCRPFVWRRLRATRRGGAPRRGVRALRSARAISRLERPDQPPGRTTRADGLRPTRHASSPCRYSKGSASTGRNRCRSSPSRPARAPKNSQPTHIPSG